MVHRCTGDNCSQVISCSKPYQQLSVQGQEWPRAHCSTLASRMRSLVLASLINTLNFTIARNATKFQHSFQKFNSTMLELRFDSKSEPFSTIKIVNLVSCLIFQNEEQVGKLERFNISDIYLSFLIEGPCLPRTNLSIKCETTTIPQTIRSQMFNYMATEPWCSLDLCFWLGLGGGGVLLILLLIGGFLLLCYVRRGQGLVRAGSEVEVWQPLGNLANRRGTAPNHCSKDPW